ncbi:MAG: gamma-glutamyl-gamma-aminobutyrate hydrolase family protein [Anaerolineae bacterium]|nr:gamma-glutamyl-gamma-aminobutyrate hydrolase family protein [Anaerolineae bacterium]
MQAQSHSPLIGITIGRLGDPKKPSTFALGEAYVKSIQNAGGNPVLLPMGLREEIIIDQLEILSGIVLTGGGDVAPEWYGAEPDDRIHTIDRDRDRQESFLVKTAVERNIPFLGICRGIQIINVALGGSLYADVMDDHPAAIKHDYYPDWPRDHYAHNVSITTGSVLDSIFQQPEIPVNSLHHQGIRTLGQNLDPIAFGPDALIEAVILRGHPYGVAVQWHPECLPEDERMQKLFISFVEAARKG